MEWCYKDIDVYLVLLFWAVVSKSLLGENEEHLSSSFDDTTTPLKACGDLAYHVTNCGGILLLLYLHFVYFYNDITFAP